MHTDTSLYAQAVNQVVNHFTRFTESMVWLPENILFDIFYQVYNDRSTPQSSATLSSELRTFNLFSKLLKVGNRRGNLHQIIQFSASTSTSFLSSLVQDFGEFSKDVAAAKCQKGLEAGVNFGGFLMEAGRFLEAINTFRICLSTVDLQNLPGFWREEIQCRLLNSLSNYCMFTEAETVFNALNNTVKSNPNLPKPLVCRIFNQFSVYSFLCSSYNESFEWSLQALKLLDVKELKTKVVIDVLRQGSKACIVKREFVRAEMLIKQAVSMCRETFGINHAKYADCLVDFGFYLLNIDSIAPSMQVYQNALDVRLNYFGGDNLRVAVAHEDLAYCSYVLEYSSGHFQDAQKHALSSLSICSELLPEQHLLLASPKRVLALILEEIAIDNEQNPLEKDMMLRKAEELHLFALKMSISCFGERNVQTAKHHGNLGRLYQTMHRYSAAEEMHLKAIRIKEDLLGPDDYEVALSVGHLASLYNYDMKEFSKAEQLYLRSIRIGIKLFGPSYSGLEYDYRGLIQVYNATENQARLEEFNNILQSWSILKEEKEVAEQDHGSVVDVKLSVSLADLLNIVTSLPSLAAGSCSGASVVSRGLAPTKLAGSLTT